MRLVWHPLALMDRDQIMQHMALRNVRSAILLDESFEFKAEQARQLPELYKAGRYPGTREIVVRPNYVMVYRINTCQIEILRILHARQQWP